MGLPRRFQLFLAAVVLFGTGCAGGRAWSRHFWQGDRALHHGRYAQAERHLEAALKGAGSLPPWDLRRALTLDALGDLYFVQGDYAKAEGFFRRAQVARERSSGKDSPEAAAGLVYMAELHDAQGKSREAELLYGRALEFAERQAGDGWPVLAERLDDMALHYQAEGRWAQAEELYRRSLAIAEKALGARHPAVAARLDNLALLHHSQGRFSEAEPFYRQALAIREKSLAPAHPDLVSARNALALFYEAQEKYAQAEELYRKVLSSVREGGGADDARLLATLGHYASLLRKTGRPAEADKLDSRAKAILRKAPGRRRP